MQRLSSVVKEKVEAYVVSGVQEERKIELLDNLSIAVEKVQNKFENAIHNKVVKDGKEVENLCSCLEDVFQHGLREKLSSKVTENLSYWTVIQKLSMKEDIQSIYRLSIIQTDVNRCHAWIRMKLKDHTIGSYIGLLTENSKLLKEYYNSNSFLRDAVKTESVRTLLQYVIASLDFYINIESNSRHTEQTSLDGRLSAESPDVDVSRLDFQHGEIIRNRRSSKKRAKTPIANIAPISEFDSLSNVSSDRSSNYSSRCSSVTLPHSPQSEPVNGYVRKADAEVKFLGERSFSLEGKSVNLDLNRVQSTLNRASDGKKESRNIDRSLSLDVAGRVGDTRPRSQRSGSSCSSKSRSSNGSLRDSTFDSSLSQEIATSHKATADYLLRWPTDGRGDRGACEAPSHASPSRRVLTQKQKDELNGMMESLKLKINKPLTTEQILEVIPIQKDMSREEIKNYIDESLRDYFSMGIITTKGSAQKSPSKKSSDSMINSDVTAGEKIDGPIKGTVRPSPSAHVSSKTQSLDEFLRRGRTRPPYWSTLNTEGTQSEKKYDSEKKVISKKEVDYAFQAKMKLDLSNMVENNGNNGLLEIKSNERATLTHPVADQVSLGTHNVVVDTISADAGENRLSTDQMISNKSNSVEVHESEGQRADKGITLGSRQLIGELVPLLVNDLEMRKKPEMLRGKDFASSTSAFEKHFKVNSTALPKTDLEITENELTENELTQNELTQNEVTENEFTENDVRVEKLENGIADAETTSNHVAGKELVTDVESIDANELESPEATDELNFVPGICEESITLKHSLAKPISRTRKANTIGHSNVRHTTPTSFKGTKSLERDTPSKIKMKGPSSTEANDLLYGFRMKTPTFDSTRSSIDTNQGYLFDDDDYVTDSEAETFTSGEHSERERIRSLLADLGVNDDIIGMKEDHFATPDSFMGFTNDEELENAIETCKERVKSLAVDSEERKHLVRKLVQLRLKQHELKEAPAEDSHDVKKILGHHFTKQGKVPGNYFCDSCGSTIWALVHTLFRCQDCSFHCHRKCLKAVDKPCVSKKVSGSVYITDITPECGLSTQQYRCADCRRRLVFRDGCFQARLCDYTGQFYCSNCHWNDTHVIPARVIHNWDFGPRKICRQSKHLLNLLTLKPIICLRQINPALFNFVEDLRDVRALREQILSMKKYLISCRIAVEERLLLLLQDRQHFVENSEMYTMQDLLSINSGKLLEELSRLTATFGKHIKFDCLICQGRGFICEICRSSDVIFPFDFNSSTCPKCLSLFHRSCFRKEICPKCKRVSKRKSTEEKC